MKSAAQKMSQEQEKMYHSGKRVRSEKSLRAFDAGMLDSDGFNGTLYELARACDAKALSLLNGRVEYETQEQARVWQKRAEKLWGVMHAESQQESAG